MAEYNVGDKVILKDDGQVYRVIGVRTEDLVLCFLIWSKGMKEHPRGLQ